MLGEAEGGRRKAEVGSRTCLCLPPPASRLPPLKDETAEHLPALDEFAHGTLCKAPLQRFTKGLYDLVEAEAIHNVAHVLSLGKGEATARRFRFIGIPEPIERCWVAAV